MPRTLRIALGLTLLLGLCLAAVAPARAHDGEHPPSCDIAPRETASLGRLLFDDAGTPIAHDLPDTALLDEADLPNGEAADEEAVAAADAVVHLWLSCQLNGDVLRTAATMTDELAYRFIHSIHAGRLGSAEELTAVLDAALAGTPVASVAGGFTSVPRAVRMLEDGRVAGIWHVQGDEFFVILERVGEDLNIDEIIDVVDPATPTA